LINYGLRELWDDREFTYHTWHPGQAGADNYLGPHDGRHMSTTSIEALTSGRVSPLAENEAIHLLRTGAAHDADEVLAKLIPSDAGREWDLKYIEANASHVRFANYKVPLGVFKGFRIMSEFGRVIAYPVTERRHEIEGRVQTAAFEGISEDEVKEKIVKARPARLAFVDCVTAWYVFPFCVLGFLLRRCRSLPLSLPQQVKSLFGVMAAPFIFIAVLLFAPAPLIGKLRRLRRDSISEAKGFDHIAATLNNLIRWGSLKEGEGVPVVLTDRRRLMYFLLLLRLLRLAPRIIIRRVSDVEKVRDVLTDLESRKWSGQLLVPAELFNHFHAAISPMAAAERLVVV
jgi:hypothetical protein